MTDLTVTLKGAVAAKLRKLISEKEYARPEDALADALDALEASRDPDLDGWLKSVAVTRAEAHAADATRALTPDQVRALLRS